MKKLFTILAATVIIMATCVSCNKDKVSLNGTWKGELLNLDSQSIGERTLTFNDPELTVFTKLHENPDETGSYKLNYTIHQNEPTKEYYFTTNDPLQTSHYFKFTDNNKTLNITGSNSTFLLQGVYKKQ